MSDASIPGILVVDDQAENRLLMSEYLDDLGLPIDEAESGERCLELLNSKPYTLVIMDIQMPGLNGFEVLEIMRNDEKLADIPVVFVSTVYDSEQHIVKGISGGAIDFIAKPVNINILKSKVSNFLKLYEKQTKLDQAVKNLELANQRLKANERKFKGITDSASDSIILLDHNYKVNFWNKASHDIFGYSKFEILSEDFFEILIAPKSWDALRNKFNSLAKPAKNNVENTLRLTGINKLGVEFPIEISLSSFISEGCQIKYTVIIRDITRRIIIEKEALKAKELQEANKMIKEFMDNVSHELRTPMNAILGISNLILKYNSENLHPKQIEGLQIINQSGTRLLDMINDVLDLAKLDSGKVTITKEEVDLENMLATLRSMVISLIDKKEIKFIILKSPHVPNIISSDYKKINQILLNLLSNAVKFTQKGKIHLFIHQKEEKLIFEVTDTGIGISEENLSIIFERFRQIDNSESKEYKGTGLGLNISKSYAELLGGNITVESVPGKGTTMRLILPVEETILKTEITINDLVRNLATQINDEIDYSLPLAIIIDHNEQNNFWYSSLVREYGYTVLSCLNSSTGFTAIKHYLPDLVLLKFEMPKIHGQFIIHQIAEIETLKTLHCIITTSIDTLQLPIIPNPYSILNEPVNEKDLVLQLDKINIHRGSKQSIDRLYLYEQANHFKEIQNADYCFHSTSLPIVKLLITRRIIKELILDGFEDKGVHSNLISWLANNQNNSPEKIVIVIKNEPTEAFSINHKLSEIKTPISVIDLNEAIDHLK